jgi:hypothetical protein
MKSNLIILVAGIIVFILFATLQPDTLISILFGFSAIGIGCTIKFLILNVHALINKVQAKPLTPVFP